MQMYTNTRVHRAYAQTFLTQHYDEAQQALTSIGADESLFGTRHCSAITTANVCIFSAII